MHDVKDERVVVFNSIEDGVVAYRKTAQTGAQIFITATAKMGVGCQAIKGFGDTVNLTSAISMLPLSLAM